MTRECPRESLSERRALRLSALIRGEKVTPTMYLSRSDRNTSRGAEVVCQLSGLRRASYTGIASPDMLRDA
jgi:hypothetical protein